MKIILYKRCASICARIDHLLINPEIVHLHEVAFAGPRGILNSDRSTAWERPSILPAGRISRTRQICILSLYCLSYMYKFSFDSIHLSAVRARAQLINLIIFLTQTFPETDYKFHFVHLFYLHCGALIFFCSLNYYLSYLLDFISIHTKYRILFISFNSFCTVYNSHLI